MISTLLSHIHASLDHLIAGSTAGLVTTAVLHPLDLIKIRMQAHDGNPNRGARYSSSWNALRHISRSEGVRALYQGLSPNLWGSSLAWGMYFLGYNVMKEKIQDWTNTKELGPAQNMLAAATSGVVTQILTNPIWVVKTRMCIQPGNTDQRLYNGLLDGLYKIWKKEGVQGFYRGILPGLLGVSHGALQFMSYEELKKLLLSQDVYKRGERKMGSPEYMVMAAISKMFATAASYPYQVVRTRLQNQGHGSEFLYQNGRDVVMKVWKNEGLRGFFKGLGPNLLRVTPATCITFVVYENVSKMLKSERNKEK